MATTMKMKCQATTPKQICDRLWIEPGNAAELELTTDGRIVLTKIDGAPREPF